MDTFDIDVSGHAQEVGDFLASFYELCYAFGGTEKTTEIQSLIKFRIQQGCDMVEAIHTTWEEFRRQI